MPPSQAQRDGFVDTCKWMDIGQSWTVTPKICSTQTKTIYFALDYTRYLGKRDTLNQLRRDFKSDACDVRIEYTGESG